MLWSLCAPLALMALQPSAAAAAAPQGGRDVLAHAVGPAAQGTIQGRVMTRTAPAHPVARQVVHLAVVERGASSERGTVTDAGGGFRFAGLPVGGVRVFVLSTEYGAVRYTSERLVLLPTAPVRTVELAVYEPSTDRSKLRAPAALAVVDVARGALRVSIVQRFENPTDRTVAVTPQDPLVFPLPPGAQSVRFLAGWRDPRIDSGKITDAFPLPPGGTQVAYVYGLETQRSGVAVPWALPYGADLVEVLVADVGVEVAADGLAARGTIEGPNGRFLRWSGGPISPGHQVVVRLAGVPLARNSWPAAAAAGLALVLAGGMVLSLRRARRAPR